MAVRCRVETLLGVLATHPNRRAANAVRLQLLTGARIGEVLAAQWTEIDFERGVWTKPSHHTKQKRMQHLPLSAPAMALLADWRAASPIDDPHLFPGDVSGKPLQDIKNFWRGVTKAADLHGYHIHDNRHTHASHLISSGLGLGLSAGSSAIPIPLTTKRYAHLADDPLRAAADQSGQRWRRCKRPMRPGDCD